ncbi:MAG: sulfur carrier protein ThiS [Deltaproteobacteria bacterium]|nr:sulfur carrier protein ThiS [Deltaproteobacteria bacterium]
MRKIRFNGEIAEVNSQTISELLDELSVKSARIAVEINSAIISKDKYLTTQLSDGDKVEIVHFVGGG